MGRKAKFNINDMWGSSARAMGFKKKRRKPGESDGFEKIAEAIGLSTVSKRKRERKANYKNKRDSIKAGLKRKSLKVDAHVSQLTSVGGIRAAFMVQKYNKQGPKALAAYISACNNPGELTTLCRFARKSAAVAAHLVKNEHISEKNLKSIAGGNNAAKNAVLKRKDLSPDIVKKCLKLKKGNTPAQQAAVAKIRDKALRHKDCPAKLLKIGFFTKPEDRISILGNPSTSAEVVAKGDISNYYEAIEMAKHPNCPSDVLAKIQDKWGKNPAVGRDFNKILAKNKNLTPEAIDELAKSKDTTVLSNLAKWVNANVLDVLLGKRDRGVRLGAAQNPNITPKQEKSLLKLNDTGIDLKLAANSATTSETQDFLYSMENNKEIIALNLAKRYNLNEHIKYDMIQGEVDEKLLQKLAASGNIKNDEPELPGISNPEQVGSLAGLRSVTFASGNWGGRCARCGRPITGKHGQLGDKCRRVA